MLTSFEGRTAVVSGAASGIGLALARRWAEAGMNVVMADVDEVGLKAAAMGMGPSTQLHTVTVDVSEIEDMERLKDEALSRFGRVNLLCNNAGVGGRVATILNTKTEDWSWVLGVNFFGVLNGIRIFLPHLLSHGEGYILNTASAAGFVSTPAIAPYIVSKHAVVALSEVLYKEMAATASDVGVSVLCPGMVATRLLESERTRPSSLRTGDDVAGPSELEQAVLQRLTNAISGGRDAEIVAEAAYQGVVARRFYIFPDKDFDDRIRDRQESIKAMTNPSVS